MAADAAASSEDGAASGGGGRKRSAAEARAAADGVIAKLRAVDVLRSDVRRLEEAVAECRSDNSKTAAGLLRQQEELIQSGALLDRATMREPLQIKHLEKFVLDQVEQERRARAEELSEVRRWAQELVHSCMQTPVSSGVVSPNSVSVGSNETTKTPVGSNETTTKTTGTRRSTNKASLPVDSAGSTTCSASVVGNDVVHFGVAAMQAQLSELQDELARGQERFSSLASRVAALEQGEGGREAAADLARVWEENRKLFSAVTAIRELREENSKLREENSKIGAAVGQSTPRHPPALPAGVATAPATPRAGHESDGLREEGAPAAQPTLRHTLPLPVASAPPVPCGPSALPASVATVPATPRAAGRENIRPLEENLKLGAPAAQPTLRKTLPLAVATAPPVSCGPPAPPAGGATAPATPRDWGGTAPATPRTTSPPPGQLRLSPAVVQMAPPSRSTSPPPGQPRPSLAVARLVSAAGPSVPAQAVPPLPHGCFWQAEAAKATAPAGRTACRYSVSIPGLR